MSRRQIFDERLMLQKQIEESKSRQNCYYHKDKEIQYFCTNKRCTLPLCEECLVIHKKQHISQKEIPMENIISFTDAKVQSIISLRQRAKEIQLIQQKFQLKISKYRESLIQAIDQELAKITENAIVEDKGAEIILDLNHKQFQIQKGSLKELIKYYEDIHGPQHFRKLYKLYSGEYFQNIQITSSQIHITQAINAQIINRNKKDSQNIPSNIQKNCIQKEKSSKDSQKGGEFNNEDEKSEIQEYKYEQKQIHHQHVLNGVRSNGSSRLKNIDSINQLGSSRSTSRRKKGISLIKAITLGNETQRTSKLESEKDEKRKDWRQFVNMGEKQPGKGQKLQKDLYRDGMVHVFDPNEMKQLIIKKRMEEKQKSLKKGHLQSQSTQHLNIYPIQKWLPSKQPT